MPPAPARARTRWMGVGASAQDDAATATRTALEAAVEKGTPAVVLLFISPWRDVGTVARTAREVLGNDVSVVGCTTAGEITGDGAGSGHVVAVALGGPGLQVATAVGRLEDGPRTAGEQAAAALAGIEAPYRALVLLADGLAGARAEVVRGAYGVAGAGVPLVGGCAADELAMQQTFQLCGDEVLTNAVVGVGLGSPSRIAVGVGHGWRRLGDPLVVTDSDGQRILTLDDRPATEGYFGVVGVSAEEARDPAVWRRLGLFHPIGLTRPGGEEIRAVLDVDLDEGALICADVPQGTVISVMEGDAETADEGTHAACAALLDHLGGVAPVGVVAFDCAARRALFGDDGIGREVRTIGSHFPDVPLGGFYTQGEFARTRGARGVHNATLALLALT